MSEKEVTKGKIQDKCFDTGSLVGNNNTNSFILNTCIQIKTKVTVDVYTCVSMHLSIS